MYQQNIHPSYSKLSEEELKVAEAITGINDRKNYIQDIFINSCIRGKFSLVLAPTGFGKTTMGIKYINRLRKVTNEKVIIVVPTTDLQTNWKTKLEGISNVEVYVVNSYVFNPKEYICHTLIVDEVHRFTNRESEHFSTVFDITERKYTVCYSATMEWHHTDFLKTKGLANIVTLSVKEARRLEIVPKAEIINVPVEFNKKEKNDYVNVQKAIDQVCEMFLPLGMEKRVYALLANIIRSPRLAYETAEMLFPSKSTKELAEVSGVIRGKAANFMRLILERKKIIYNTQAKFEMLDKIIAIEKKSSFIFATSIESISNITREDVLPYHSKMAKKKRESNMKRFLTEDVHLASIKSITTGLDLETKCIEFGIPSKDIDLVINVGFNSSKVEANQKSGRANRIDLSNDDKIAKTYNIFVDDFMFDNQLVISQEKIWLQRSQSNEDRVILMEI